MGYGMVALFAVIVALVIFVAMRRVQMTIDATEDNLPRLSALTDVRAAGRQIWADTNALALRSAAGIQQEAARRDLVRIRAARSIYEAAISRLDGLSLDPSDRRSAGAIRTAGERLLSSSDRIVAMSEHAAPGAELLDAETLLEGVREEYFRVLDQALAFERKEAEAEWNALRVARERIKVVGVALGILAITLALAIGLSTSWSILRPLRSLEAAVEGIRSGDLSVRAHIAANDELGALGESFDRMAEDLERNLTERKQDAIERTLLEEQLRQAQKMEAVGRLAGGIAHDFNNLLTAILGYSELMEDQLPDDKDLRSSLHEIHRAGERAAALTRQLLAFSRKQVMRPRTLDLNAVVPEMEKLLQRLIGEDVTLTTLLGRDLDCVNADPGQLEQVIMNLAVNARDAMPEGGTLTITTENAILDAGFVAAHPGARAGEYAVLTVSDSGTGMSEEVRRHLFEPFFTTKEQGKGTGLGLATAYGIVKQSDGYISVESEPGRGSSFRLYFPRVAGVPESATTGARLAVTSDGIETILLVEDEVGVRRLSRTILETQGYTVLEAASGEEALAVARAHRGEIHLVATDVVMPGMSGRMLWDRLLPLRPNARVLFISGYTDDAVVRHGVHESGIAFLEKPFTPHTLAEKVREALDAA